MHRGKPHQKLAREMLRQHGTLSTESRVGDLAELIKRLGVKSSTQGFDTLESMTNLNLTRLEPKIQRAEAFVIAAEKKWSAAATGENTALQGIILIAETAPAKMAISIYKSLKQLLGPAKKAATIYPLMCLKTATHMLIGRIDDNLLREGNYNVPMDVISSKLENRLHAAMALQRDIAKVLREVPDSLGVKLPGPPSVSKVSFEASREAAPDSNKLG